jgi:MFS family permease
MLLKSGVTVADGRKNGEKITAFVFGVVFVVVMLYIALYVPNPTETQWFVFRVVLALAAAGVGALLPGLLTVQAPPYVRAGGALPLFVIRTALNV